MRTKGVALLLGCFLAVVLPARSQTRRVYQGVVGLKPSTIGTLILMDVNGNNVTGWMSLGKFVPIEGGAVSDHSVDFRAAGNTYKIDESRERIIYSGPDGSGDRLVTRLTSATGIFKELMEGEEFGGSNIATLDINARLRRFTVDEPSLWKLQGPPFEKFHRLEELLQRQITCWISGSEDSPTIEVIEEPQGMNISLKAPKKPKEKKK